MQEKYEKLNGDLRQKVSVLQQELCNNEAVQKDFVRLSQSLQVWNFAIFIYNVILYNVFEQMELEKIRAADTAVRWQDDDDVEQCPSCKSQFAVTRRKVFYFECLNRTQEYNKHNFSATLSSLWHHLLWEVSNQISAVGATQEAGSSLWCLSYVIRA